MLPGSQTIVQLKYDELPERLRLDEEVRSWQRNPCVCPGLMLRHAPKMPNDFVRVFWTQKKPWVWFFSRLGFGFGTNFLSKMDVLSFTEKVAIGWGLGWFQKCRLGPVSANPCRIPAPKLQLYLALSRLTRWISRWKLRKSIVVFFNLKKYMGFPTTNDHFGGVLGIPPFKETPIYDDYISDITLVLYCKSCFSFC